MFPSKIGWYNEKEGIKAFHPKMEPIPKDHESVVKRLIIPAEEKRNILDDLKLFGISKASLFPDSVDKVCEEIKEIYF